MPTCSLNPVSVAVGTNAGTATLTVTTIGASAASPLGSPPHAPRAPVTVLLGLALLVGAHLARRRRWPITTAVLAGLLFFSLLVLATCGGGGNGGAGGGSSGTPAGNYTITVTGTSGTLSNSTTVTLVVQ
jgi:peptidoglycan/LPS O-acetylase OafA/YrhL